MDMKIGPFQFYQGIRLSGRLVITKYSLAVDVSVTKAGIKVYGELPAITWGPLRIYKPKAKGKPIVEPAALALRRVKMIKSASDLKKLPAGKPKSPGGPVVFLEMTQANQVLYISGAISLWSSKLSVILYLSPTKVAGQFEMKLANLFWVFVDLRAGLTSMDFSVDAKMKNDFAQVIRQRVDRAIKKGVQAIEAKKRAVGNARKRAYDKLDARIRSYRNTIASLNRQKSALKRQLLIFIASQVSAEELEGAAWAGSIRRAFRKVGNTIKRGVTRVVRHVKRGVKTVARGISKAARWVKIRAQIAAIDVKIKWNQAKMWGVEKIAKGAVYLGTKIAQGVLSFVQLAMKAVNKAIQWLLSRFTVKSAQFKCSIKSKSASGKVVYRLGVPKDQTMSFSLDFSSPEKFVSSLSSSFAKSILGSGSVRKAIGLLPLIDVDTHLEGVPLSLQDKAEMKSMVRQIEMESLQEEGLLSMLGA